MTDKIQDQINTRTKPHSFLTEVRFEELNIPKQIISSLNAVGLTNCSGIQEQILPISLTGRDVAGQAQTGTGKTAAFLITIFTRLMDLPCEKSKNPSALIVAPTRELASQIYEEAKTIGHKTDLRLVMVVGGIDYQQQLKILEKGVDVVICTPGRIIDYIKQDVLKTSDISLVVIDEADRLFDLGFTKDMRFILSKLPNYTKRQSMLFSATLSYRVMELTYEYMNLPEFISITPDKVTVEGIEQSLFHVEKEKKLSLLLGILARENVTWGLIFVNTKAGVDWLTLKLKGNGWAVEGITGDRPQNKRFKLMEAFKNGTIKLLIATDVASRGIHVENISHVINYDLPQDPENYVHRIGRTARAGKTGRALSLACETYVYHLEPIEDMLGSKIPVLWPEDDWFLEDKAGHISVQRKPKAKKTSVPGRKASDRKTPAGRKSVPKKVVHEHGRNNSKLPEKPSGYFPGTFFGFTRPKPKFNLKSWRKSVVKKKFPWKKQRQIRRKKRRITKNETGLSKIKT